MRETRERQRNGATYKFVGKNFVAVPNDNKSSGKNNLNDKDQEKDKQIRHLETRIQYLTEDNDIVKKELEENNYWLDNQ